MEKLKIFVHFKIL